MAVALRRLPVAVAGEVRTLTPVPDGLLVGRYLPGAPGRPGLSILPSGARNLRDIALHPAPGYGAEAQWLSVATHAGQLTALGGAPGGAHSNTRWTVWQGDATGLVEQPQEFNTFGGEDAGGLVGVAYAGDTPVLVGSWRSASTGLDIAVWRRQGAATWVRDTSTGTALASTPTQLVQAAGVASTGPDLLVVGSTTVLPSTPGGDIAVNATVWRGAVRPDSRWTWTSLPLPGASPSRADAVTCDAAHAECLVVGRSAGHAVAWLVRESRVSAAADLGGVPVGDADVLLAPARTDTGWYAAVRRGPKATPAGLLVGTHAGTWRTLASLDAGPVALVATGGALTLALGSGADSRLETVVEGPGRGG